MLLRSMFEVVVMVADGTSLIESASQLHPALAVVDLSLDAREASGGCRTFAPAVPASR